MTIRQLAGKLFLIGYIGIVYLL